MKILKILNIVIGLMFLVSGTAYGTTIKVPDDYPTIQAAIDAAVNGDIVEVANGTYKGSGNRDLDFNGKEITVRSKNGPDNCIIDCEDNGRGFYFHSGEGTDSVVMGFTITNGNAFSGGGIFCDNGSSPTIRDNIIIKCHATGDDPFGGGAIDCRNNSNAVIINNKLAENSAVCFGGGINFEYSSVKIENNYIVDNTAALTYSNCQGGGISGYGDSSAIIANNLIVENSANMIEPGFLEIGGGGIALDDCGDDIVVVNNTLVGNQTKYGYGGGIFCDFNADPTIMNNIIVGSPDGEGIWVSSVGANPIIDHNDIWDNADGNYGGSVIPGPNDITVKPLFMDPTNYDFHLTSSSPCIDAGTSENAPNHDFEGDVRPQGLGYDIGADEYVPLDNVNDHVSFEPDPSTYLFTPDTTDCQAGAVGKFSFDATLTNISEKELSILHVRVDELTNNNLLLTDNELIGEGERFEVPKFDEYADLNLAAEEFVDVPFTICLTNKKPFRFFVDVLGMVTKRFEEDKCELIGDWELECESYPYSKGCAAYVNFFSNPDPGAYATLEFEGMGIYWIGAMTYNAGIFKWIIDEGTQDEVFGEVDTWIPGVVRVNSILLTNKLVSGKHTIKYISLGINRFGESLPSETYIDAFDVIPFP